MVVTCLPTAPLKGTTQERTAAPSRCTVHEPHCAMQQPYLVPVRPICSRMGHSRGVLGLTLTSMDLPLIVKRAMAVPPRVTVPGLSIFAPGKARDVRPDSRTATGTAAFAKGT